MGAGIGRLKKKIRFGLNLEEDRIFLNECHRNLKPPDVTNDMARFMRNRF